MLEVFFPNGHKNAPGGQAGTLGYRVEDVIDRQLNSGIADLVDAVDKKQRLAGAGEFVEQSCQVIMNTEDVSVCDPASGLDSAVLEDENRPVPRVFSCDLLEQRGFTCAGLAIDLNEPGFHEGRANLAVRFGPMES